KRRGGGEASRLAERPHGFLASPQAARYEAVTVWPATEKCTLTCAHSSSQPSSAAPSTSDATSVNHRRAMSSLLEEAIAPERRDRDLEHRQRDDGDERGRDHRRAPGVLDVVRLPEEDPRGEEERRADRRDLLRRA